MNKVKKVGRNDPCPCGSGKKYKKCCLLNEKGQTDANTAFPTSIMHRIQEKELAEQLRRAKFGEVRPCIHADFDENKFVAVGNELHYSPKWRTFPDFLLDYIKHVLGTNWGNSEIAKPFEQRHEIMKWYDAMCRFQKQQTKEPNGLYEAIPNGAMKAYLLLAYDLYTIKHNGDLQNAVVARLKNNDQFQGVRHELFAAATCVRAGYEIAYEDETDRAKKHTEFTATHKSTGQKVSVEAKSRRRPGVLGHPGQKMPATYVHLRIVRLLNAALKKLSIYPLVIFLDINLPPLSVRLFEKPWLDKINKALDNADCEYGGQNLYNIIVLSNQPYNYYESDEPAPKEDILSIVAKNPQIPASHPEAILAIHEAANKFGKIPNRFDEAG